MPLNVVPFDNRKQQHPTDSHLPEWLAKHEFLMLIVAPAGSGKTTLLLNILLRIYKQYWHRILIFSPTIHNDAKWEHLKEASEVVLPPPDKNTMMNNGCTDMDIDIEDLDDHLGGLALQKQEDSESWHKDNRTRDLDDLKENDIADPFETDRNTTKRVGLSKLAYEASLHMAGPSFPYKTKGKKGGKTSKDDALKHDYKAERLSALVAKPPLPLLVKCNRSCTSHLVSTPKTRFERATNKEHHDLMYPNRQRIQNPFDTVDRPNKHHKKDVPKKDKQSKQDAPKDVKKTQKESGPTNGVDPDEDFHEEYSEDTLNRIMEEIDNKVKELQKTCSKSELAMYMPRTLWVFDDMVGSGLFNNRRANAFKRLTVRRRHYYSSMMGVTQAYKEIPKTTRTNADILIFFRIDSEEELVTIYREYPMGHNYQAWRKIVEYCTKDPYSFCMFNLQTADRNFRITKNFDEPLSLEKQHAIIGGHHAVSGSDVPPSPSSDSYDSGTHMMSDEEDMDSDDVQDSLSRPY